ncbi:MAG: nitrous oxide reductase family maturation protein NosD, partial [Phototrophicales bacterium]
MIVSPDSQYKTIHDALDHAQTGDTIEVHAGIYSAPLEVTKSVSLIGIGQPVIDGEGEGTIVVISADDVEFRGFVIRNTGTSNSHEDSGIVIQADRVTVEDNLLEDVLFGIYFADAEDGVARNNIIRGYDLDPARRGDGIRVWFSSNVRIENNDVAITRDILIWFADNITIVGNTFHDARYGLHFMYSDNAHVEDNHFIYNSVGTYLMYSTNLTVVHNELSYNRGPSGYGIALKDMDSVVVKDNWFVGNRVGLYLDNSPALYEGNNEFSDNAFAYNDVGVTALPNVERNIFTNNTFLENIQQTGVRGRGNLQG